MKQHTPGEWVVSETYLDGCFTVITKVAAPEKKNIICDIWGMDTKEGKANAKLIAAAPELLDALETIKSMCDGNKDNENDIWHIANKAIKKATL